MNKKRLSALVIFLLLLVAIPLSLYLIQNQQILKGRATPGSAIEFPLLSGNPPTTNSQTVQMRLTYDQSGGQPFAPVAGTPAPPPPTPAPTQAPVVSRTPTPARPPAPVPPCTTLVCTGACILYGGGTCGSGYKSCQLTGQSCVPGAATQPCTIQCAAPPTPPPSSSCKTSGQTCSPGGDAQCCSHACYGSGANWQCR